MTILAKIILAVIGIVVAVGLFWYAGHGRDLMPNGKKLLRSVAVIEFIIIALIVIFEETI